VGEGRAPAARTLTSPGVRRPEPPPARCVPHAFARAGPGLARCQRCGREAPALFAAGYLLGLDDGRVDAWARPDGPRRGPRARWLALAFAVSIGLLGAAPASSLPPPPPHEALEAFGDCAASVAMLDEDATKVWGRLLAARCDNDACAEQAETQARQNRARVRAAAVAQLRAQRTLDDALHDARRCASSGSPACLAYAPAWIAEARASAEHDARSMRYQVETNRLSKDTATP
jgi:hypothetical protein